MSGMKPMFTTLVFCVLGWPDRTVCSRLVGGFEVVGEIAPSNIFRTIEPKEPPETPLLGKSAEVFVDELEADTRIHPQVEAKVEETEKEVQLGLAGPEMTREECDDR